jgi:hypothetical protein
MIEARSGMTVASPVADTMICGEGGVCCACASAIGEVARVKTVANAIGRSLCI